MRRSVCLLIWIVAISSAACAQDSPVAKNTGASSQQHSSNFVRNVFDLFNMAGTEKSQEFRALSQPERNRLYVRSMANPLSFLRVASSAGIDQAKDKPPEWRQGSSAYGKRFANIFAQYSIQRTVTYGLGSALHEDNRYFNSGKHDLWPRTRYALASGILARRDDGTRRFSISQIGGVAAGAFLARTWLPSSQETAGDAAVSFGITMGTNISFGVVKEFLPDMVRPFTRKKQAKASR